MNIYMLFHELFENGADKRQQFHELVSLVSLKIVQTFWSDF